MGNLDQSTRTSFSLLSTQKKKSLTSKPNARTQYGKLFLIPFLALLTIRPDWISEVSLGPIAIKSINPQSSQVYLDSDLSFMRKQENSYEWVYMHEWRKVRMTEGKWLQMKVSENRWTKVSTSESKWVQVKVSVEVLVSAYGWRMMQMSEGKWE